MSAEGWHDELINAFEAKAPDPSFSENDMMKAMEADSFVRDLVTEQQLARRSTGLARLQVAQQKHALTKETGVFTKQWLQVGVKVTGPTEEEEQSDV